MLMTGGDGARKIQFDQSDGTGVAFRDCAILCCSIICGIIKPSVGILDFGLWYITAAE